MVYKVSACQKYQSEFEGKCPAQWVKYFTKRRVYLKYKRQDAGTRFHTCRWASAAFINELQMDWLLG
uniref:Uncharacterized protein n=1 Tax=Anguilla anguilla TaxID=7936 RepID=A0A0E9P6U2_ANGAN